MIPIAVSTTHPDGGEYALALAQAGAGSRLLAFDPATLDEQLAGAAGVLLTGGGDVDPQRYGAARGLAGDISTERDEFEVALVRRARERGLPTLCICRGVQVANVAFGGTLVVDIAETFGAPIAAAHRVVRNGRSERGMIEGHAVAIAADARLTTIVGSRQIATGSRHHQSLDAVAPDLRQVAATADGIVEAVEARFASPFWLGIQWHPESTLDSDGGTGRALFAAFVTAAERFVRAR